MPSVWERQPSESGEAYAAFLIYRDLGAQRTLDEAYRTTRPQSGPNQAPKKLRAPGAWKQWRTKYDWNSRATAWDRRTDQVAQQAHEQTVAVIASDRAARILEQERRETQLADLMHKKLMEMLEVGLVRRKVAKDDNGNVTVFEPAKWSFGTVARMSQVFLQLGRVNLQMPTRVDPAAAAEAPYFDTSGEMDDAMPDGAAPAMPEEPRTKPRLAISAGDAAQGLINPTTPVRPKS